MVKNPFLFLIRNKSNGYYRYAESFGYGAVEVSWEKCLFFPKSKESLSSKDLFCVKNSF